VGSGTAWPGSLQYLLPDSNDFYIGNYPGCSDREFRGAIDDVTVWNRTLGASEVSALMPSSGSPGGQSSPPPGTGGQGGSGGSGGSGSGSGGGSGSGSTKPKTTTPSVMSLKLSTTTITVDPHGHLVFGASSGPLVTYTESQAASMTMTLLRSERGVRRGKSCVKPSRHSHKLTCTHFVLVSSVMRTDKAGKVTVSLNQLLRKGLSPGTYRLDMTPRAHGKVGKTVSVRFVVRRSRVHH
jgi:hypothetical protein